MKVFDATPGATRTAELTDAASPWYRRPGILIAAAALIAGVGIVVSGSREPGIAPGGTTGTSTPWSVSFSLVSTDIWEPPPAPPAPAPPAPEPPAPEPPPWHTSRRQPAECGTAASSAAASSSASAAGVKVRRPVEAAFVSITNNDKPAVGCVYRSVAVAGLAASVNFHVPVVNFTVTGSAETRIRTGEGPATGSTLHVTVTCDNGLSTSRDVMY